MRQAGINPINIPDVALKGVDAMNPQEQISQLLAGLRKLFPVQEISEDHDRLQISPAGLVVSAVIRFSPAKDFVRMTFLSGDTLFGPQHRRRWYFSPLSTSRWRFTEYIEIDRWRLPIKWDPVREGTMTTEQVLSGLLPRLRGFSAEDLDVEAS